MVLCFIIIPLIVFRLAICSSETVNESGTYKIEIAQFKPCNTSDINEKYDIFYNILTEYQDGDKKRPCFTGNITLNREINDDLTQKIYIETMEGDTWKNLMSFTFKKGCSAANRYDPNWFKMMNTMNMNVTDCPISKGFYSFNCVKLDGHEYKNQRVKKLGRYRAMQTFSDKDTMVGCASMEGIAGGL